MHGGLSVNKRREEAIYELSTRNVLFSCEGTAESVLIERLVEADKLIVPSTNIVHDMDGNACTNLRSAKDIQREFLGIDYPRGLLIARIVDSNPGRFLLEKPYRLSDIKVYDFITRPEIEVLVLVREKALDCFNGRSSSERQLNASDWCKQKLGLTKIKTRAFLEGYWNDADELVRCIREANGKRGSNKNDQLGLTDLLKQS